ncbi:hypothetical protein AB1Y20_006477 [Prymnesium parvum]|uniref:Glutathione synthase n=1 Tax=Prymnesium parvum TaxID=97485 RepID=A0AB34J0R4_PRYPA
MQVLAQQLRSEVTLRKASHLCNDRSLPRVGPEHLEEELDQEKHEMHYLQLGMEKWLPHVSELSFETAAVPLSMADGRLLRQCYAHLHGRTYYDDSSLPTSSSLPPELVSALSDLGQRLYPTMKALGADGLGVFGKLSGRSAKDAPLHTARLDAALLAQLSEHRAEDDNTRLLCLFEASLALMRLTEPAALLWMLINSQRVDEDLDVALRHPEEWDQAIIIRRWWDGVATDLEFRMFVVDGEPTGLTQYNQLVYSPRVASRGAAIAAALCEYYKTQVYPKLVSTQFYAAVGGRFTCDLALHPSALDKLTSSQGNAPLSNEDIKLVELNCFYEATGMGLFDYHADSKQLTNGPFEWKVRKEPVPHVAVKLENEWRDLLREAGSSPTGFPTRQLTDDAWQQLSAALHPIEENGT